MTQEKQLNTNLQNGNVGVYQQPYQDDEIDLRELFFVLWKKKLWIVLFALTGTSLGLIYANMQPNIYESKAILKVNADPYDTFASEALGVNLSAVTKQYFEDLKSTRLQDKIAETAQLASLNVSVSMDVKSGAIIVSKRGEDAQVIFDEVLAYSKYVNQIYIQQELAEAKSQVDPVKTLIDQTDEYNVKKLISKKYAHLIYKVALLESGSIELVKLSEKPIKPINHIKSKRALIVILATLLAGMLSIFITLVHHVMTKKESD